MSKHKVFISYHHGNDKAYKEEFEEFYCAFLDSCISRSVGSGDIDDNLSDEEVREIIRDEYLKNSTVTVVLVGKETYKRKHVDWEIYSSLYDGIQNKRSGLIGVLLPTYPDLEDNKYNSTTIPPRLYDNIQTKYAKIYKWDDFVLNCEDYIDEAYKRKNNYSYKTDLSRPRFKQNRSGNR